MGVAPKWAALSILIPLILTLCTVNRCWTASIPFILIVALGLIFILWAAISLMWTSAGFDGLTEFWKWTLILGSCAIGAAFHDLKPLFIGAGAGLAISSGASILERLGVVFNPWSQVYGGLFYSPNFLCEVSVLVAIWLLVRGHWKYSLLLAPAIALAHTRGALLASGVAFLCWLWARSKQGAVVVATIMAIAAGLIVTSGYREQSNLERVAMWADTAEALTIKGYGIASFHYDYPAFAKRFDTYVERPDHTHNDLLELSFEYGVGVLALIAMVMLALWFGAAEAERLVLIGFLTEGIVGFPLHLPATAMVAAMCLGHLVGYGRRVCVHEPDSRMVLQAGGKAHSKRSAGGAGLHAKGGRVGAWASLLARWRGQSGIAQSDGHRA